MSDQPGTEDAITKTINCATAKILGELDNGAGKERIRIVILGELNGIRRFVIKRLREHVEGPVL